MNAPCHPEPAKDLAFVRGVRRLGTVAATLCVLLAATPAPAANNQGPNGAALFLDFDSDDENVHLHHGVKRIDGPYGSALEFTNALQYAETPFTKKLHDIDAMSVGGWFFP